MDWNNDGRKDLVSGDSDGKVWLFLNEGSTTNPVLAAGIQLKSGDKPIVGVAQKYDAKRQRFIQNTNETMGIYSKIHVGDWDGDGLKDLLIGQDGPADQQLVWYRNVGTTNAPLLDKPVEIKPTGTPAARISPYLIDWDGDGTQDLLLGTEGAQVYFCRNKGTRQIPELEPGQLLGLKGRGFEDGYRSRIEVTDWNNDGKLDLLVGNASKDSKGNIWLFLGK